MRALRGAGAATGIGIGPEVQPRLLPPFEQARAAAAHLYGETGFGSSTGRQMAGTMDSRIQVKSMPGAAAMMSATLALPHSSTAPAELGSEATPAGAPKLAAVAPGAGPLVLAVDDHPINLKLLARQIAAQGLRVQTAEGGWEALAQWQAGGISLVVTDCTMPRMDGYTLARAIREIEAKEGRPRTPIIAWTAMSLLDAEAPCYAAGMDDILTKPAGLAILKQMLAKWLPHAATEAAGPDDAADTGLGGTQIAPIGLAELDKIAATAAERAEILLDFMTQTRSDFAGLHTARTMHDLPACARIAHRMKGSSRMVGARDLAAACETMERAAQQCSPQDVASANAAIDRALQRLEAHVADTTGAHGGAQLAVAQGLIALVVEDDNFQRQTVVRMLRALGARETREAADGKQALALTQGIAPVDLVICDLDMPEMDGMELMRHLGQVNSAISVIIASAQDRSLLNAVDKMAHAYGVRLLGVIEKPVTFKTLKNLIALHEAPKAQPAHAGTGAPSFSLDQIVQGVRERQFEPFFQPKMELATGRVVGAEALARWRHPEHGLIGPYAFIAPLEQSGMLDELTLLMLEKAAGACRAWRERGMELTVSVNLSLVSLTDTTLASRITETVRSAGLDPHYMILEITETTAMTEVAPALENLARLRMRGFGLSIDDYGTGFSSLRQLTRVPFTELKIDQSFVAGCAANPSSRAIVESSVEMARRLGIKSVAEGVETQADWDVLQAAGCDVAQGYFIAKPMQASAFLTFCTAEAAR